MAWLPTHVDWLLLYELQLWACELLLCALHLLLIAWLMHRESRGWRLLLLFGALAWWSGCYLAAAAWRVDFR